MVVAVESGEFLALGEFRQFRAEEISWKDGDKARTGVVLRHTVEFGNETVFVSEFAKDGVKAQGWPQRRD